jgi:hypothetical protein
MTDEQFKTIFQQLRAIQAMLGILLGGMTVYLWHTLQ